jgi:multidrug efflux pump subunit AcrA (membrane-fusion protein)
LSDIEPKLLSQLRIGGEHREDGRRRAGAAVAGAGRGRRRRPDRRAAWWLLAARPIVVQTATAIAPGSGGGAGAVLQATGYITARRQATVSTQITGTLTEVLIEEGVRVEKGQVIARLEDSGLRASLALAEANVKSSEAQVQDGRGAARPGRGRLAAPAVAGGERHGDAAVRRAVAHRPSPPPRRSSTPAAARPTPPGRRSRPPG